MNEKTRVALADDHPIILSGLGNLIEAESDLELVGQGHQRAVRIEDDPGKAARRCDRRYFNA